MKKSVIYNLLGTIFDKGLPLLISLLLTKFMSSEDYGRWSLLYSFILIAYAFGAAPVLTFFSRNYHNYSIENRRMYLYFHWWVILIQVVSVLIFYLFFIDFSSAALLEITTIVCLNMYSYIALFYRFNGQDSKYLRESFSRLIIFAVSVFVYVYIYGNIPYLVLIGIYVASHFPSLIRSFKFISIRYEKEEGGLKEFFLLSAYGLASSLITSLDRFIIIGLGLGFSFLGYYSFIYTIANTPAVIVEAFKKAVNPTMYKDLSNNGKLSDQTKKTMLYVLLILFFMQLFVPSFIYYILSDFELINKDFINKNSYFLIGILSFGLFFVAIYQMISPYYFFFKKTKELLIILIACLGIYVGIVLSFFKWGKIDIETFSYSKTILLCLITMASLVIRTKKRKI
nr:oligosaccharide flippase family protein [uncultured Sphingobacterium sp.]